MLLVLLRKELICLWDSIFPEPGQPSAQLSKLIRLTACKKTKHAVSRWYRTVYIPWLVASYDTHKGKHWQYSKPLKPQGLQYNSNGLFMLYCFLILVTSGQCGTVGVRMALCVWSMKFWTLCLYRCGCGAMTGQLLWLCCLSQAEAFGDWPVVTHLSLLLLLIHRYKLAFHLTRLMKH